MAGTLGSSHGSKFNTDFGSNFSEVPADAIAVVAVVVREKVDCGYARDSKDVKVVVVEEEGADGVDLSVSSLNQALAGRRWNTTLNGEALSYDVQAPLIG